MGVSDVMPGVSGGTMALITGIYQRLVHAISEIDLRFIPQLLKGDLKKSKKTFLKIDFSLFIPLVLGIGLAVFSMAHVIEYLLASYTGATYSFFFGLILASALIIFNEVKGFTVKDISLAVLGFVLSFLLAGLTSSSGLGIGNSLPVIFLSGLIAICAMILPGISGAFLLLLFGQYEFIISAIKDFNLLVIIIFSIGALIGILSFSKVLNKLLENYKVPTIYFLIGLMLGALRLPYGEIYLAEESIWMILIPMVLGFSLVVILERKLGRIVEE